MLARCGGAGIRKVGAELSCISFGRKRGSPVNWSEIEPRLLGISNSSHSSSSDLSVESPDKLEDGPPAQTGQPASGGDEALMIAERDPLAEMLLALTVLRPKQS
jgi:hypothetical protein